MTQSLVLVSGLSGSGKSIALKVLEDAGYYCVDNLPATLLLEVADFLHEAGHDRVAVSVDARSAALAALPESIAKLNERGFDCRVLYLEASTPTLLRRFSETRRRHPLAGQLTLPEAIERERALLARWLPEIVREHRASVTVAIGCTGGRHRSVYVAERLAEHFRADWKVLVRHRGLAKENA